MRILLKPVLSAAIFLVLSACASRKAIKEPYDAPFENIDFKAGEWMLLYTESDYESRHYEVQTKDQWIITDQVLLDSLKREYKCLLAKTADCFTCYSTYLFKDHCLYTDLPFDIKSYYSFGELKKSLVPVSAHDLHYNTRAAAKAATDSLKNINIPIVYYPDVEARFEYTSVITIIPLKQNPDKDDYTACKQELLKLYPELTPGQILDLHIGYLKIFIDCDKDFVFDASKLNGSKTMAVKKIEGPNQKSYSITYYTKR